MSLVGMAQRLVRFLLSIQFGVVLIIFLMVVMMFATQFEVSTSTRAMKRFIYGSVWFDIGVFLFVINIIVNTWRRRPFKFRHTGFLTVHAGVLICVAGGLTTRYAGIDGSMPIPEQSSSGQILLPDTDLIVEGPGGTVRHRTEFDLTPWEERPGKVFAIPGSPYSLVVDRYFPTGAVVDTLLDDSEDENPLIRIALGARDHEPTAGWLAARDPAERTLSHGGVAVSFVEAGAIDSVRSAWERSQDAVATGAALGDLELVWNDGTSEQVSVPADPDARISTSRSGVEIEIVQVFRSFMLTSDGQAADAVDRPDNPAIRFRVVKPGGLEEHVSFTAFPDFRAPPPEGVEWLLSHSFWTPDLAALPQERLEVAIAPASEPGRFHTYTSWSDSLNGAELELDETRAFASERVFVRVMDYAQRGRLSQTVRRVSDEITRPVIHVALMEPGAAEPARLASVVDLIRGKRPMQLADSDPNRSWLFHNDQSIEFPTPDGPIVVRYEGRTVPLDFTIQLDDFREETYPGISLAASYESHVTVYPAEGEPFQHEIYMNHPLKYEGYTFYQASFQRTRAGEEITVLSVARDPGMQLSFLGYCVLSAGLLLIFFVKPYFRKLDERIARGRALRAEGART